MKVAATSIGSCFTLYFIASLFGYLTFFNYVQSELLMTYSHSDPTNPLTMIVRICVLIGTLFGTSIQFIHLWLQALFWPYHWSISPLAAPLISSFSRVKISPGWSTLPLWSAWLAHASCLWFQCPTFAISSVSSAQRLLAAWYLFYHRCFTSRRKRAQSKAWGHMLHDRFPTIMNISSRFYRQFEFYVPLSTETPAKMGAFVFLIFGCCFSILTLSVMIISKVNS